MGELEGRTINELNELRAQVSLLALSAELDGKHEAAEQFAEIREELNAKIEQLKLDLASVVRVLRVHGLLDGVEWDE